MDVSIIKASPTITEVRLFSFLVFYATPISSMASLHQLVATKARPDVMHAHVQQTMALQAFREEDNVRTPDNSGKNQDCHLTSPTETIPTAASSYLSSIFFDFLDFSFTYHLSVDTSLF